MVSLHPALVERGFSNVLLTKTRLRPDGKWTRRVLAIRQKFGIGIRQPAFRDPFVRAGEVPRLVVRGILCDKDDGSARDESTGDGCPALGDDTLDAGCNRRVKAQSLFDADAQVLQAEETLHGHFVGALEGAADLVE